ncbi:sorbosone dehydrogenase family protein [Conexibacter sp. SYSU D00693]|uniref:PQQ-dependent sugar dehydrogenase n=1 Tax=Conexibacter sp. SYSU D00693 TaxID=2812560 RepID=UPI00196BB2EE|nr:PQQ-dependent sugar dehydrogenase [Conexibacter sp. SYSU D00693]
MRRTLLLGVLAVAGLAACGAGGDDDDATASAPAATTAQAPAETAQRGAGVRLARVGSFTSPLYVTAAPGDRRRVFVVEQGGRIVVVRGGRKLRTPFLDLRSRVQAGGEQGLLGLAFPRDYAKSGRFYVYHTRKDGRQTLVEHRRATADRARPGAGRTVFVHADPEANHNGGQLQFGPDGLLYVGTGDGGGGDDQHGERGNAQDLGSPLGKLLRIDPRASGGRRFRVPPSNPFVGRPGARPEVYAYGLRNPWRFSFDRRTGDLAIGDVGQNAVEEVDFVTKGLGRGANFGWRPFEGSRRNFDEPAPGAVGPVIEHAHGDGWCSITGGYVVRDPGLRALAGRYVYGDFCQGVIRSARLSAGGAQDDRPVAGLPKVESLASFGEDAQGRVYVVSLSGTVWRLAAG